jgi:hypothetical protein
LVHEIIAKASKTLKLARADLIALGVDWNRYAEFNYARTQLIGAAVAYLNLDGLIAPSARWECDNVTLFMLGSDWAGAVVLQSSMEVDWRAWAREHTVAAEFHRR